VIPQSYIEDACSYLNQRWSLQGSPPGTVVLPVMFHSITRRASSITDIKDISQQQFDDFVAYSQSLGFKTITVPELIAFLEDNARIPARSMILIFDDRRLGVVVNHVQPVWEKLDWRVTLAYITGPVVPESEWHGLEELAKTGRIDVQAHGYYHRGDTYIVETTPLDVIEQEVYGPIEVIEKHFGYQPTAFIWPGGNFTDLSVDIARQAGYRVGFTVFSRGPLLYNWIPLGEPEIAVGDPLLVLPRAWSYEVNFKLYQAAQIGDQARQFAVQNYPLEATWYRSVCGGELPSLESSLDSQPTP
jgi:peptidoglycan/xylan/chitin deacetylase (PgdA/CDA1 family)